MAASKAASGNGRLSAPAWTTSMPCARRCAIMVADGSTATTRRSVGSYDPAPAPTLTTVAARPRLRWMQAAILGSGTLYLP